MGLKNFISHLIDDDSHHPETSPPPRETNSGSAAGTLARVLRILGESTPLPDARASRERMEKLAREAEDEIPRALSEVPSRVEEHRKSEKDWIDGNMRQLAEGVLGVLQRLGKSTGDEREDDRKMDDRLEGLRGATKGQTLEQIRRDVLAAVESLSQDLRHRQERREREMADISGQLSRLKSELTKVRREASLDPLTKLSNRAALDEHLESCLAIHRITGRPTCLLMVDVDHFKRVNDTHGHVAGDLVLRALADCMVKAFPRKTDFVARYGGEEFAVVLSEDDLATGMRLAERLLGSVRDLGVEWEGQLLRPTVSVGVAGPDEGDALKDWVERADRQLYKAKSEGRDRVM